MLSSFKIVVSDRVESAFQIRTALSVGHEYPDLRRRHRYNRLIFPCDRVTHFSCTISVSTTCYDDPNKDQSGPALIKHLADKANTTYVRRDVFEPSLFAFFSLQWIHLASTVVPDNQTQLKARSYTHFILSRNRSEADFQRVLLYPSALALMTSPVHLSVQCCRNYG